MQQWQACCTCSLANLWHAALPGRINYHKGQGVALARVLNAHGVVYVMDFFVMVLMAVGICFLCSWESDILAATGGCERE